MPETFLTFATGDYTAWALWTPATDTWDELFQVDPGDDLSGAYWATLDRAAAEAEARGWRVDTDDHGPCTPQWPILDAMPAYRTED